MPNVEDKRAAEFALLAARDNPDAMDVAPVKALFIVLSEIGGNWKGIGNELESVSVFAEREMDFEEDSFFVGVGEEVCPVFVKFVSSSDAEIEDVFEFADFDGV